MRPQEVEHCQECVVCENAQGEYESITTICGGVNNYVGIYLFPSG